MPFQAITICESGSSGLSLGARVAIALALLLGAVIAAVVVLPLVVLSAVVFGIVIALGQARRLMLRLLGRDGAGRRNVRVIAGSAMR